MLTLREILLEEDVMEVPVVRFDNKPGLIYCSNEKEAHRTAEQFDDAYPTFEKITYNRFSVGKFAMLILALMAIIGTIKNVEAAEPHSLNKAYSNVQQTAESVNVRSNSVRTCPGEPSNSYTQNVIEDYGTAYANKELFDGHKRVVVGSGCVTGVVDTGPVPVLKRIFEDFE